MNNNEKRNNLPILAAMTDFPGPGFAETVKEVQLFLDGRFPELGSILEPFTEFVSSVSLDAIQELHTRTFEVQAITTLDLGYLLFGDDYKRAELLVNLNREHTLAGNDCGHELADHLPNVIRLVARMADEETSRELIEKLICPGLKKMIAEFNPLHLGRKNEVYIRHHKTLIEMPAEYGTLYRRPLGVLLNVIQIDFGLATDVDEKTPDFLSSISTEMKLED